MTMSTGDQIDKAIAEIRQQRDELRVRLHLAKAEVRDEWEDLEKQWEHLQGRLGVAGKQASEAAGNVGAALGLAVEEIRKGYRRIRSSL
jgi:chromosome segregation ATPase